ncbi:MAG: hypothetical protein BGO68_00800 [Candidatus Amoebophilus sp. 36-38]|nr:MAG: hypothetical protein BGO68_00800 [Candidatus Amoebophilus sp. 36-38]
MHTYPKKITAIILLCSHMLMSCWNSKLNLNKEEVNPIDQQHTSKKYKQALAYNDTNLPTDDSEQVALPEAQEKLNNLEITTDAIKAELKPSEDTKALTLLTSCATQEHSGEVIADTGQKQRRSIRQSDGMLCYISKEKPLVLQDQPPELTLRNYPSTFPNLLIPPNKVHSQANTQHTNKKVPVSIIHRNRFKADKVLYASQRIAQAKRNASIQEIQAIPQEKNKNEEVPRQYSTDSILSHLSQIQHISPDPEPLIFIAQGGHVVTLYQKAGRWQAKVQENLPVGFTRSYRLPVVIELGLNCSAAAVKEPSWQKQFIHVEVEKGYVYVGSRGLKGGMKRRSKKEKKERMEENARQKEVEKEEKKRDNLEINSHYQYEDIDIQAILLSRLKQLVTDFPICFSKPIHVLAAVDDIIDGQLRQRLEQEKAANQGKRVLLIPCNLGNFHWVGILIEIETDGQILRAEYINSLNNSVGAQKRLERLEDQLKEIYPNYSLQSRSLLKQNDSSSCGAYTIENLLLAIGNSAIPKFSTEDIRRSHLDCLKKYNPKFYDAFYIRQRDNRSTTASIHEQLGYLKTRKNIRFSKQEIKRILAIKNCLVHITNKTIKKRLQKAFETKEKYRDNHILHLNAIRKSLNQNVPKLNNDKDKKLFQELIELLFGIRWDVGSSLPIDDNTSFRLDYNLILAITQCKVRSEKISDIQKKLAWQIKQDEESAIKLQAELWVEKPPQSNTDKKSNKDFFEPSLGEKEFSELLNRPYQQIPNTYNEAIAALLGNNPQVKIIDLSKEKLNKEQFKTLKEAIDNNFVVGYIDWGDVSADCQELKTQIEDKLVQNICTYTYHPSDYVHGLLSNHVYEESKIGDKIDLRNLAQKLGHELPTSIWKIEQVQDDTKESGFYSALYVNETTHQAVLAFQGSNYICQDYLHEDPQGILGNAVTRQQEFAYTATKGAADYAKKSGFNLSITGHSLGGYLAELGVAFCFLDVDYRQVKAIVFDSPGTDRKLNTFQSNVINPSTKLEIGNLPITVYLSAPNFVNSCNGHPGEAYRVHPKLKGPDWLSKLDMAKNLSGVGPVIQIGHKSLVALLGHSLDIILGEFDSSTGKPKEYVRVKDWPKLNTDNIEHVGKENKLNTLLKPYLGDVSAATSSMASVLRDLPNLITGEKQYWITLKHLDEDYKEQPLGLHDEFEHKYVGHYQISPINIDKHPLYIDSHESIDGYLHALWEDREEIVELKTNDITGDVLKNILRDYTIADIEDKPCLLLKQNPTQIQALRDKMQRAKDVFTSTRIKEALKHSKKQAVFNYVVQEFSKQLEETHIQQFPKLHSHIRLDMDKLKDYIPRKEKQEELDEKLKKYGVCVVYGHGGVGKSTLVAKYSHDRKEKDKQTVCWTQAETRDELITSYEYAAKELGINDETLAQLKKKPSSYLEVLARKVYNTLEDRQQPVLLILDNAIDRKLIDDCLLHRPSIVQAIITTRNKMSFEGYNKVQLDAFTSKEAKKYIQQRLQSLKPSKEAIQNLIDAVGRIPQKLELATGSIREIQSINVDGEIKLMNVENYITKLRELKQQGKNEDRGLALPEVNLGLEILDMPSQLMMRYGSYLDPDLIPLSLVTKLLRVGDARELNAILTKLEGLSLITIIKGPKKQGIQIHREVQAACKAYQTWGKEDKISEQGLVEELLQVLNQVMPKLDEVPGRTWNQARLYAPQVAHFLATTDKEVVAQSLLADLMDRMGSYNSTVACNYQEALKYHKKALEMRRVLYKDKGEHSDIACSLNNLGIVYYSLRQYEKALKYHKKALEMRQVLYKDKGEHSDIACSFNNLGIVYYSLRQYEEALKYHKKALEMYQQVYIGNHPDIANSLNNIGYVYQGSGQYEEALRYYKKSLKIFQAIDTGNHPIIANSLHNLGIIYQALGKYKKALKYSKQALNMNEALYIGNHPDIAISLNNIAAAHKALGDHQEALRYYKKALKIFQAIDTGNHPDIANLLHNIGTIYSSFRQYEEALKYSKQALNMNKALYIGNHPDIANSLNNIGVVYSDLGQHQKALEYLEKALEMRQALYTGNHPDIANSLHNIGVVYSDLFQHEEALKYLEQALQIGGTIHYRSSQCEEALKYHKKALKMRQALYKDNGNHPDIANSLHNLGMVYSSFRQYEEALKYHGEALEMRQALYIGNHPDIANSLHNLGTIYSSFRQYEEALKYHEQALEMRQALYKDNGNHPDIANSLNNIGMVYYSFRQYEEALKYHEQALKMRRILYKDKGEHSDIACSLNNLGIVYYSLRQYEKALKYHEQALKMMQDLYEKDADSLNDLATKYRALGNYHEALEYYQEALKYYQKALEMRQALYPGNHPDIANSLHNLGTIYFSLMQYEEALKYHKKALEMRKALYPGNHSDIIASLDNVGTTYRKLGQHQEALEYFKKALEMRKALYPGNHPDIASSLNNIGYIYLGSGQYQEALKCYQQALEMWQVVYTGNHPDIEMVKRNIARLEEKQEKENQSHKQQSKSRCIIS